MPASMRVSKEKGLALVQTTIKAEYADYLRLHAERTGQSVATLVRGYIYEKLQRQLTESGHKKPPSRKKAKRQLALPLTQKRAARKRKAAPQPQKAEEP